MKKWLVAAGIGLVALVVLIVVGVSSLGSIVKNAVNSQGPLITGTDFQVGHVDVALFSGRLGIENFLLGNPEGYEKPYAVEVKTIRVEVDKKSLAEDTVIIRRVEVIAPRIIFEKRRGSDNFQALLNNVQKSAETADSAVAKPSGKGGKKLLIREFILRDGKVNLAIRGLNGRELHATLPEIRLRNIGQQQGGATPGQVAKEVFTAIYARIAPPGMRNTLQKSRSDVGGEGSGPATEAEKEIGADRD